MEMHHSASELRTLTMLQDTLVQREEELARLQENKLKQYLNSTFVKYLEKKTKKLLSRSGLGASLKRKRRNAAFRYNERNMQEHRSPFGSPIYYTPEVSPNKTGVAFTTSLNPHCNVKTHSFSNGQAFVQRDTEGEWRFTWVPTQSG
ncbi:geminin coiled-coil domain-containing protein 1-like [Ranitomeya imitator]|uniref:geminin coiled-coil domain-containing protein 1-like n=1 Tax=Ranitomeya imitator TaxID=111125 RepID=UPI0037E704BA